MEPNPKIIALGEKFLAAAKACPELVYADDPKLRQRSSLVSATDTARKLFGLMRDTLERYRAVTGVGRGIAAPQIGQNYRAIAVCVGGEWRYFLNPRVVDERGRPTIFRETCLSCGPVSVDVIRPPEITLEWDDERGVIRRENFSGFMARLLQHEVDHLNGVLCVDKAMTGSLELCTKDPLEEVFRPFP